MARSLLMVARQNPGDLPLALCAARAAVKGGLEAEALEAYRLVHQSDPTEPEAALALATEALNAGQLDAALRIALPAAEKAGSARLWSLVGLVYKKNNQPDNAVAAWRKSLAVDANQGDLWREIGAIFAERGDLSEALDAAQKALAANPNDAAAWYYLAVIQANGRELDEAIQSASRSLSLEPRFAAAYYLLAVLHGRRGNADAAYSALIEAFAIDPSLREKARNSGDFRGLADASARFRELLGPARSTTAPAQP